MLKQSPYPTEELPYYLEPPTEAAIRELAELLPGGVRDLISTRGRVFRERRLKLDEMTDQEIIDLLIAEPRAWRRPVLRRGKQVVIGENVEQLRRLIGLE